MWLESVRQNERWDHADDGLTDFHKKLTRRKINTLHFNNIEQRHFNIYLIGHYFSLFICLF